MTQLSTGETVIVEEAQPARTGPAGIWVVTKMTSAGATRTTGLPDGRHAVRIKSVDVAHQRIVVDVVQLFLGDDAARAAAEDHAPEVPPPNDFWLRSTSSRLRTLAIVPGAMITVNVHGASESGSSTKDSRKSLAELAAMEHLAEGCSD